MIKRHYLKRKISNYLYDHINLKYGLDISRATLISILAAAVYAFGFVCFVTPVTAGNDSLAHSPIVTGGVGGISLVIYNILYSCGLQVDIKSTQAICYSLLNVPLLIFAFFKIGKRFAIITAINVILSSIFIQVLPIGELQIVKDIAAAIQDQQLTRTLFAGLFVGFSSALAFKADVSCGGVDIVGYYFGQRKSSNVGKYIAMMNVCVTVTYSLITIIAHKGEHADVAILNFLFSLVYLFVTTQVVDTINIRNKKMQIQIISNNQYIASILIANFPHSNTIIKGTGGYSHSEKNIVYMTVSSNEVKNVVEVIKKSDPNAFISVFPLVQAYGNFFVKPVK